MHTRSTQSHSPCRTMAQIPCALRRSAETGLSNGNLAPPPSDGLNSMASINTDSACSPEGEVSFQWLGRESDCPQLVSQTGKSEFAYFYRPFSDWLSLQPMIARASRQSYLPISSHDYGPPCFSHRIADDRKRLAIAIGLTYNPWMHQSASRELAERIFAHISESCPAPDSVRSRLELHFVHVRNEIDEASWIRSQPGFKIT